MFACFVINFVCITTVTTVLYEQHYCKLLSTIDRIIYFGGGPSELNRRLRLKENTIHCTVQYGSKLTYCMRVCAPASALLSRSTTVSIRYGDKNGGRTALPQGVENWAKGGGVKSGGGSFNKRSLDNRFPSSLNHRI